MTTQIIDFSEIDLTGGLRFNGEAIGAAHYNGERLWPFGVDLLYTGGIGGASYLPDPADVYGASALAVFSEGIAAVLDEKNGTPVLGPELAETLPTPSFNDAGGSLGTWDAVTRTFGNSGATAGTRPRAGFNLGLVTGRAYLLQINFSGAISKLSIVALGSSGGLNLYSTTTGKAFGIAAATNSILYLVFNSLAAGETVTIDSISVREVPGLPALQPSASLRPLLGRAPKERRNVYLGSDLLEGSSPGLANGATIVRDGVGFGTTLTGTSAASYLQLSPPIVAGRTVSFFAAAGTSGSVGIGSTGSAITASFNLTTGVASNGINTTDAAMEPVAGGYRCSFKALASANLRILPGTGSINIGKLQIENGNLTPYQSVSLNGVITTEEGVSSYPFVRFDLSDDRLDTVLPQAVTGDVVIAGRNGSVIAPHSYAVNSTFQLGPTSYTGGTPGILRGIGDVVGWSILNKTLTAAERERLMRFYKRRGAKGLLVPGPELVVNGTFETDLNGWVNNGSAVWSSGGAAINRVGSAIILSQNAAIVPGKTYEFRCDCTSFTSGSLSLSTATGTLVSPFSMSAIGSFRGVVIAGAANNGIRLSSQSTGFVGTIDNISVRELRPEEDW